MSSVTPPGRARSLMMAVLPSTERDEVCDDLDERFRARAARTGPHEARSWYRRQAIGLALWGIARRFTNVWGRGGVMRELFRGGLGSDLVHAARALGRNRVYATVAILTVAVGIGGTTAVFSVIDGVLLRPLPFPEPTELVAIHETRVGQTWWSAAPSNALAWQERSRTLSDVAWGQARRVSLLGADGDPESVLAVAVSSNMFDLLEVPPFLGRTFEPGEDDITAAPVAVMTYDSWLARFAGSADALGTRLMVDGVPHTLVGVLPPGREPTFFGRHELLVPRILTEAEIFTRGRVLQAIGRLGDGVAFDAAYQEMAELGAFLDQEAPGGDARGWGVHLVPLKDEMVGDTRTALMLLLGSVAFVLLVACANVSNLMLVRGNARARELAVRASLGAGEGRLARHLLAESLLIALFGGALGLLIAVVGTDALLAIDPGVLPRLTDVGINPSVLAFTALSTVAAAVMFGLLPAVRASRVDVGRTLLSGGERAGSGRGDARLRDTLVAAEVALVVVLLIGAGMMVRGVRGLTAVDPGFETDGRVAVRLTVPQSRYPDSASVGRFVHALADRAAQIPGVTAAGTVTTLPLSGGPGYTSFHVARSLPEPESGAEPIGGMEIVSPGYFAAMGIPIMQGRDFTTGDSESGEPVIIADEGVAALFWPDSDPLADAIRMAPPSAGAAAAWRRVVGLVGEVRYGLDVDPRPRIYVPEAHVGFDLRPRTLVLRVRPDAQESIVPAVRAAIADVDPLLPIERIEWLDEISHTSISRARLQSVLLTIFAAVALGLGAIGVYGVVSYTVLRRTREVGLRLALGASQPSVVGDVVRGALAPVGVGLVIGAVGSALLIDVLSALSRVGEGFDAVAFGLGPALLLLVAIVAAFVPGLRASRVDPIQALRQE